MQYACMLCFPSSLSKVGKGDGASFPGYRCKECANILKQENGYTMNGNGRLLNFMLMHCIPAAEALLQLPVQ